MKGFALDNNGDVIIEKNKIKMIDGVDLINQTVKTVLGTNKTEWFLNIDEGIDFNSIKDDPKIEEELAVVDEDELADGYSEDSEMLLDEEENIDDEDLLLDDEDLLDIDEFNDSEE